MSEVVSASTSNKRAGSPLTFKPLTIILASLLAASVIATVGSLSDICLGDENYHVRQGLRCEAKASQAFGQPPDSKPLPPTAGFFVATIWRGA